MAQTIRKRRRTARRLATPLDPGLELLASQGEVAWALCHAEAPDLGPTCHTTFRRSVAFTGMHDVEIRGFPGEAVKFVRNVATQYHVRVGCENLAQVEGRFEIMRVLQRWDLSSLPTGARVRSTQLTLHQENHQSQRHYWPLHWPVTFYVYAVKKDWNPGQGGSDHDNLSPPEPGDAWWMEARAGEQEWSEPGCGYGHDQDPLADRGAQPLAAVTLSAAHDPLVFSGPRLAAHVESVLERGESLELLLKASDEHELIPGSTRSFYSAEFGEDETAHRRPSLQIAWQAPTLQSGSRPFVLEPASRALIVPPAMSPTVQGPCTFHAALSLDANDAEGPQGSSLSVVTPEVHLQGWIPENEGSPAGIVTQPVVGRPAPGFAIELSTLVRPVLVGDAFEATLLQTWSPSEQDGAELEFPFVFRSPSGRTLATQASSIGNNRFRCRFVPDEPGIWCYRWRARPDRRLPRQEDGGIFTVVVPAGNAGDQALTVLLKRVTDDVAESRSLIERRRLHYRVCAIERQLYRRKWNRKRTGSEEECPQRQELQTVTRELISRLR